MERLIKRIQDVSTEQTVPCPFAMGSEEATYLALATLNPYLKYPSETAD